MVELGKGSTEELMLSSGQQWLTCTVYGTYGGERRTYHLVTLKRQGGKRLLPHVGPELCSVPWLAILYRLLSKVWLPGQGQDAPQDSP